MSVAPFDLNMDDLDRIGLEPDERTVQAFGLLWFAALDHVKPQDHVVKNLLLAGSLFVVYGESNSGKTFLVLDLALAVARGVAWRDRRTRKGLVIYVAGEGAASVRARVVAYRLAHPETTTGSLPFAIVPQAVDFLSGDSVEQLIATIKAAEAESGETAAMVIIDTFARALMGGDENSAEDVGAAVAAADRIRAETGACVGFVHHSGKDPTKGARGSSALRAACDTEILVEGQQGPRIASDSKQRDLMSGQRMPFELEPVQIGVDPDDGSPVTSCTVKHLDPGAIQSEPPRARGGNQFKVLTALTEWARTHEAEPLISTNDVMDLLKGHNLSRPRRHEALDFLTRIKVLTPSVGGYTIDFDVLGRQPSFGTASVRNVRKRPNRTNSDGAQASETSEMPRGIRTSDGTSDAEPDVGGYERL